MPGERRPEVVNIASSFYSSHDRRTASGETSSRAPLLHPYTEDRAWGRIDLPDPLVMARTGIARYRLRVFAPGTSDAERRELTVARRWWLGTAVASLLGELIVASAGLDETAAFVVALAGLAVCWYWLARTRTIRRNTRTLRVAVVMAGTPREVIGDAALFGECRRQLALVDDDAHPSGLVPVDREAIWAEVYDRLGSVRG